LKGEVKQERSATGGVVRVAAVADLHCGRDSLPLHDLFARVTAEADVLLLCGDLVDHGLPDEARLLAREIATSVGVPTLAVLGNHDFESGREQEICTILSDVGVRLLDGDSHEVAGIGIAGIKGFAGGFGRHTLGAWGEAGIKNFVHEAVEEALKLETALSKLHTASRVAMLHYSPIAATLAGEAAEIYPFLGTSRLEEPLNRYAVDVVFHGHAHAGAPEGRTSAGIPVYNVSVPVLARCFPDRPPFRLVEVPIEAAQAEVAAWDGAGSGV
jgi:Icc-related predicted phosphoesterase